MLCISCHFITLKPLTLWIDHAKLLDILTSLPVSHAILPRGVCFATSRPANHAICSFTDSSGYASRPIRICLCIDYIKTLVIPRTLFSEGSGDISISLASVRSSVCQSVDKSLCAQ